jgi:hypothetical protein
MKQATKEKLLSALIETASIRDAAKLSGFSESNIYKYFKNDEFRAEYQSARRSIVEGAISKMQNGASAALTRLKEFQFSENPTLALRASQIIFESSVRGLETLDIWARLKTLEGKK